MYSTPCINFPSFSEKLTDCVLNLPSISNVDDFKIMSDFCITNEITLVTIILYCDLFLLIMYLSTNR